MRVLILWSDNTAANYGLRVLALGNKLLIEQAFEGADVTVDFQDFGPGDSDVSFGTKSIIRNILSRNGDIDRKLSEYDLIVDSGAGDSFADIYGLKRLSFIFYAHHRIRRQGRPLVMAPQTIGPFTTRVGRTLARRSLRYAKLVVARDSSSAKYCESLGRPSDITATDVVFGLPANVPISDHRRYDILLNVSGLLWFADEHVSSVHYKAETLALVLKLRQVGRSVTLLPHVIGSKSGNDDIEACKAATRDLRAAGVKDIETAVASSLQEMRSIMASADLVIGARMHACLNAISVGTPAIPWAYSRKFAPLLADLGWSKVVDINESEGPADATMDLLSYFSDETNNKVLKTVQENAEARLAEYMYLLAKKVDGS